MEDRSYAEKDKRNQFDFAERLRVVRRTIYAGLATFLPDDISLGIQSFVRTGRWPNVRTPERFSEFIQNRKLYSRDTNWPALVDKITVKQIVERRIGSEWVTPTLWHGVELPAELPAHLPLPLVVKPSHSSGRIAFVRRPEDWPVARAAASAWPSNYGTLKHEWAYSQVPPRLLIEPDLSVDDCPPVDYKFLVFGGEVVAIQVDSGRFAEHRRTFYTPDWARMPFTLKFPPEPGDHAAPSHLQEMINAASTLGKDLDFVRVDLYDLAIGPRFGELTFYPGSGTERFDPPQVDVEFGRLWQQARMRLSSHSTN